MPQITVTLSDAAYAAVSKMAKGKKSRFVNRCVQHCVNTVCWGRLEFMELFTIGYDDEITRLKNTALDEELDALKREYHEAEESGESGFE